MSKEHRSEIAERVLRYLLEKEGNHEHPEKSHT